jgi:hypothetical protein
MHEPKPTLWDLIDKQKSTILLIAGVVAFFFWQVVIPIQKIQTQLAQIQIDIAANKAEYDRILKDHENFANRMTAVETKLDSHLNPK